MTSLEADTHGHVGLVRLTADDGSEGWGVRVSPAWLEKAERQRPEA